MSSDSLCQPWVAEYAINWCVTHDALIVDGLNLAEQFWADLSPATHRAVIVEANMRAVDLTEWPTIQRAAT